MPNFSDWDLTWGQSSAALSGVRFACTRIAFKSGDNMVILETEQGNMWNMKASDNIP